MTPYCWFGQLTKANDVTVFQQQMEANMAVTLKFKKGKTKM